MPQSHRETEKLPEKASEEELRRAATGSGPTKRKRGKDATESQSHRGIARDGE
jgi:hypothetical protein